jgi:hypothetical protein
MDPATDRERRLKNKAVLAMAKETARSLTYFAQLLKAYPIKKI